ncbi:MAG: amino acid adenylation domain-containing protein [Thermoanaerobaculia bacterium]
MSSADPSSRSKLLERAVRLKKAAARARQPEMQPRPADRQPRLGEVQRSLWVANQVAPSSPTYNLTSAFLVHGTLDTSALERSLNAALSRHRILRSTYVRQGSDVLQVIHPPTPLHLEHFEARPGEALEAAVREARRPFDLASGPLIRLLLVTESSGGSSYLVLVLHHILADEQSLDQLWAEIVEAYDTTRQQSEPAIQYDDYVYWLSRRSQERRQELIDAWRRRLAPLPEDLRLPFEKSSASVSAEAPGRLLVRRSNPALSASIRRLAAEVGATPFMVYCFCFRLLLQRYAPEQHCAFGTPVSTRSHPSTASMIGYFTNPVVVAVSVDESQPVREAVSDFGRQLRDALAEASIPFDELADALAPQRQPGRSPIFQTMFVYQRALEPVALGAARLEPVTLDLGASKFDLTLFVNEGEHRFEVAVEYRTDRYDEVWMEALLDHYTTLLEHLTRDPERPAAEISMLDEQEVERLREWSYGGELDSNLMPVVLPRRILELAHRSPASAALSCGDVERTYGEMADSAKRVAHRLVTCGVEPGDRVGIFLDRSTTLIEAVVGSHWAGAAYVPLDPTYPEARNLQVLEDADVRAVLTSSALRDELPDGAWTPVELDRLTSNEAQIGDPVAIGTESPAYLLYTSGSTGRPKGVIVSHGNLSASTAARLQIYDAPPSRFLLLPSLAFDSSVAGLFWTLGAGGCLVIPGEEELRDPRQLPRIIDQKKVTCLLCVPSLYAQLLRTDTERLQGLEMVIVAGESCPSRLVAEHFAALPSTRLVNEYGPTETTVWATVQELTPEDAQRPVPIGRPIPGVRVEVLDNTGRQLPAGLPGEAWISGPTVAQGYWRRPDSSRQRFVRGSRFEGSVVRYRTGDRVAWSTEGALEFLGRQDEQLKIRGFRIEPGEVEAALLEVSGITASAVVARDLGSGSPQLVAFAETTYEIASETWRRDLATRLPEFMIPARLVALEQLPLLPNGKVDRQRLTDRVLEEVAKTAAQPLVLDSRIEGLISLWEGLLGQTGIGLDDNFFELGGHSLLVVEMTLAIERDFGASLTAAEVFAHPTVRELGSRLTPPGATPAATYRHLFPIQPSGRKTPFIVAVPHFFSAMFATRFRNERPVYGLRGVSLRAEGNLGRWPTLRHLGEDLVDEIQRRFPGSSCIMAGYSFGASMAIEAVRIMEERGLPVEGLYLIAPMPEDFFRWGRLRLQMDGLREPVNDLSVPQALLRYARSNNPLTRRPYQRAWRWLAIEPWRRWLCSVGRLRQLLGLPLTARILYADVRVDRFRLHAAYRPRPVRTPTVVFNALEAATDAAATWRPYFLGPFTVHPTPDPHLGNDSVEEARRVILDHLVDLGDE